MDLDCGDGRREGEIEVVRLWCVEGIAGGCVRLILWMVADLVTVGGEVCRRDSINIGPGVRYLAKDPSPNRLRWRLTPFMLDGYVE